ncbi:MAG: sugar transferase [Planctomycetota bacterium]|nr:sugar transferase [Planctomycetota bacterium]
MTHRGHADEPTCVIPLRPSYLPFKAVLDFVLSLALLVVAIPVITVAAIAIKLTSAGPAFYRQVRVGRNGRRFTLVKIRTMVQNAEAGTGPVWSSGGGDSRITPLGRLLRDSHIDELPQLFNVLAGDMSLVGPRPERPEFVDQLEWKVPNYLQRLNVKPGVTGLAQVLLPPDSGIDSVVQKLVYDVYYVRNSSFSLDLKLIAATAWKVVSQLARHTLGRLSLPHPERIAHGYSEALSSGRAGK